MTTRKIVCINMCVQALSAPGAEDDDKKLLKDANSGSLFSLFASKKKTSGSTSAQEVTSVRYPGSEREVTFNCV